MVKGKPLVTSGFIGNHYKQHWLSLCQQGGKSPSFFGNYMALSLEQNTPEISVNIEELKADLCMPLFIPSITNMLDYVLVPCVKQISVI